MIQASAPNPILATRRTWPNEYIGITQSTRKRPFKRTDPLNDALASPKERSADQE